MVTKLMQRQERPRRCSAGDGHQRICALGVGPGARWRPRCAGPRRAAARGASGHRAAHRRRSTTVATTTRGSKTTSSTQTPGRARRRENAAVTRTGVRPSFGLLSSSELTAPCVSPHDRPRGRLGAGCYPPSGGKMPVVAQGSYSRDRLQHPHSCRETLFFAAPFTRSDSSQASAWASETKSRRTTRFPADTYSASHLPSGLSRTVPNDRFPMPGTVPEGYDWRDLGVT